MRAAWSVVLLAAMAADARAVCRVLPAQGDEVPVVEPRQSVLLVLQRGVPVGPNSCATDGGAGDGGGIFSDGGALGDGGGLVLDAGPLDLANPLLDLGSPLFDGAISSDGNFSDAGGALDGGGRDGSGDAGSFAPRDLAPPCTPRIGNAVTMVVQPTFATGAGGGNFAVLLVTPSVPTASLAPDTLFSDLAAASAPLTTHVSKDVEDPALGTQCPGLGQAISIGCSGGYSPTYAPPAGPDYTPPSPAPSADAGLPDDVTTLGPYDLAVLAGADLLTVEAWLDAHGYAFDDLDASALDPYVSHGWTVTAVRLHATQASTTLTPIAVTFEGDEARLPAAIARAPGGGTVPLTAYVAGADSYQFPDGVLRFSGSSSIPNTRFLTRTDLTVDLAATAEFDPTAVDFGHQYFQEQITVTDEHHVPVTDCSDEQRQSGCACACNVAGQRHVPLPLIAIALVLFLGLQRRRFFRR